MSAALARAFQLPSSHKHQDATGSTPTHGACFTVSKRRFSVKATLNGRFYPPDTVLVAGIFSEAAKWSAWMWATRSILLLCLQHHSSSALCGFPSSVVWLACFESFMLVADPQLSSSRLFCRLFRGFPSLKQRFQDTPTPENQRLGICFPRRNNLC